MHAGRVTRGNPSPETDMCRLLSFFLADRWPETFLSH